jgi:hypothetical protein
MTDREHAVEVAIAHMESLLEWDRTLDTFGTMTPDELDHEARNEDNDEDVRSLASRMAKELADGGLDELSWSSFMSDALDVEITGTLVQGRWELSGVALLVGFGGPTVRYVAVDDSTIRVEVSWWGDSAERTVDVGLAGELWAYAEAVAP